MTTKQEQNATVVGDVTIERPAPGRPHAGKVLAAIQPHADDVSLYCGGTVAKLIAEGYTGYLIQTTNDEKCGPTRSIGETILSNEREVDEMARVLGFKKVFNLGYRNHRLDGASPLELRSRLVFLFRLLKVDTVFANNPWVHGEGNPDHYVTGRAVEGACWMAGMDKDYPEHFEAGLEPHTVVERYCWVGVPGQRYNRVVDTTQVIDTVVAGISTNKSQGPGGSKGSSLKARLAARNLRLPALDGDDETADRAHIRLFVLDYYRELGRKYGLEYAEPFYYVKRDAGIESAVDPSPSRVRDYIANHAVPLE